MTLEDIDSLEAGPKMNALVGVEVMEWKQSQTNPDSFLGETGVILGFKPSTDTYSAWEVVEKLARTFIVNIEMFQSHSTCIIMEHSKVPPEVKLLRAIERKVNNELYVVSEAPTVSLAICRVALKVILNRDKETP